MESFSKEDQDEDHVARKIEVFMFGLSSILRVQGGTTNPPGQYPPASPSCPESGTPEDRHPLNCSPRVNFTPKRSPCLSLHLSLSLSLPLSLSLYSPFSLTLLLLVLPALSWSEPASSKLEAQTHLTRNIRLYEPSNSRTSKSGNGLVRVM